MQHIETEARVVRYPIRIGGVRVARTEVNTIELRSHFRRMPDHPRDDEPMLDLLRPPHDILFLHSHPIIEALPLCVRAGDFVRYVPREYPRHIVDLRGTFDDYLGAMSKKTRQTLARKVKKFASESGGAIDFRVTTRPEEASAFLDAASELAKKTYQARLFDAALPDTPEFRARFEAGVACGAARGYLLFLRGKPAAYCCSPVLDGALIYEFTGYDRELAALSPGTVMQVLLLEHAFGERRFEMFDFTAGEGPHKALFATRTFRCADVIYARPTPRAMRFMMLHAAAAAFTRWGTKTVAKLGVRERLRTMARA